MGQIINTGGITNQTVDFGRKKVCWLINSCARTVNHDESVKWKLARFFNQIKKCYSENY